MTVFVYAACLSHVTFYKIKAAVKKIAFEFVPLRN